MLNILLVFFHLSPKSSEVDTLITPILQRILGSERLSSLPKVTQLVSSKVEIRTYGCLAAKPVFLSRILGSSPFLLSKRKNSETVRLCACVWLKFLLRWSVSGWGSWSVLNGELWEPTSGKRRAWSELRPGMRPHGPQRNLKGLIASFPSQQSNHLPPPLSLVDS